MKTKSPFSVSVLSILVSTLCFGMMITLVPAPRPLALAAVFSTLFLYYFLLHFWLLPGGLAWRNHRLATTFTSRNLTGPSGFPLVGTLPHMGPLAHRKLASLANSIPGAKRLMALSLGFTPVVISTHPDTAREILSSPSFSDRPTKASARALMFDRAIGFAPSSDSGGGYWKHLRRLAATHMFSPRRISSLEGTRQEVANAMAERVMKEMGEKGFVEVRGVLRSGSLRNMVESVFGTGSDIIIGGAVDQEGKEEEEEVFGEMVREGYELISEFNLEDWFFIGWLDFNGVKRRCRQLAAKVKVLLGETIDARRREVDVATRTDFLSVLLCLPQDEQLKDHDLAAVLWETVFRGTDTVAVLLEWIMARMVLHPDVQSKAQQEIDTYVGTHRHVCDSDLTSLTYIQAIVKETLRLHPPGPLLSWARLSIRDTHIDKVTIPAGTTAMVNMWAISHDPSIWKDPWAFNPDRFVEEDVNVMGSDLRLAPFGSGRRVCPGRAMAFASVSLWLARLLQAFKWMPVDSERPVDLSEQLLLSLEMKRPLACRVVPRFGAVSS